MKPLTIARRTEFAAMFDRLRIAALPSSTLKPGLPHRWRVETEHGPCVFGFVLWSHFGFCFSRWPKPPAGANSPYFVPANGKFNLQHHLGGLPVERDVFVWFDHIASTLPEQATA